MKTKLPPPTAAPVLVEDDIRAYAAHLYEQSGRIPNRDIENWLEAKACLEAHLPGPRGRRRVPRSRGFTMPASDASFWIEPGANGPAEA